MSSSTTTTSNTYAHGHSPATVAGHASRTAQFYAAHLLPHLRPGASVLDVGCGPGSIAATFLPYVSPGGRVVGIDSLAEVVATAQSQFGSSSSSSSPSAGDANIEFIVGDLFKLPFEDNTFDFVHAHQVIVHLPLDKVAAALREMKRVCKKGGGLVTIRDAQVAKGGLQAFPADPLLPMTMDLILKRVYMKSGVTPDSVGRFLKIAQDEVGFKEAKRQFSLDVFEGKELREMWGNQWSSRTDEEGFKSFVLDSGLASEEEVAEIPKAWRRWRDTEDGWCTLLQIEHMLWK